MIRARLLLTAAALACAALLAACSSSSGPAGSGSASTPESAPTLSASPPSATTSASASTRSSAPSSPSVRATPTAAKPVAPATPAVRVTGTVAVGLSVPWGLAFLPGGGGALVGERDAGVILHIDGVGHVTRVGSVPGVVSNGSSGGEAGLLGLALSPRFAADHLLYAYVSSASDNRVVRMSYLDGRLGTLQVVISGIPRGLHHNGGRIAFGPDGMLYVTTGESGDKPLAQNLGSLGGKILRMTPTGQPAPGNPFAGSVVYSYGHRNIEGLSWDSAGRLWATEFGDKGYDELNLIQAGHNYGWPATEGRTTNPSYTSPVVEWRTPVAGPSGLAIKNGVAWIGALTGTRLWRVPLNGASAGTPQAFLVGSYGRLRTVTVAPDGSLWVTTSNTDGRATPRAGDDRILRLTVS